MKRLSKKELLQVKRLFEGEPLEGKELSKKEPYMLLKKNGSIKIERLSAQRERVSCIKKESIFLALRSEGYHVSSLEGIDSLIESFTKESSRDAIQKLHLDTKAKKSPSLKGLFVSSLFAINVKVNDEVVNILPNNGMGYFFFYTQKIEVAKETIIVGIENYQVVWFAQKYAKFYKGKNFLFVYISPFMLEWIEHLENEYIHFGDYDLAGLNIYANKVVPHLKKCKKHTMFIPENIEFLIKEYGSAKLYQKQLRYKNTPLKDESLLKVRALLNWHKKALEQEGIIHY